MALAGVKRAFEEAEVEPAEIIGCSGGAIWGSMWGAGMSSEEMTEFSLSWRPEDYLDIQWLNLPRFALSALRGFTGLAKGEAIERLFDSRLAKMPCGQTPIPITTIVYNMDLGKVEYFGSARTPEVTVGHLVRVAIALPLFIESVSVRGHLYVDGGIIENWPARPAIEGEGRFDHVIGVNLMLPKGFEPRDISGWPGRTGGLLEASRQLQQGYHLELARRARDELGEADPDRADRRDRDQGGVVLRSLPRSHPVAAADPAGLRGGEPRAAGPALRPSAPQRAGLERSERLA